MHLIKILKSKHSSAGKNLLSIKKTVESNNVWRPKDDVIFVFLCGANIEEGKKPSKRRQDLIEFSKKNLKNSHFFLAENIFSVLKNMGHNENLLDVENDISIFADYIVIVLESESSFCELGAFSTDKKLRGKIIVINDLKYHDSSSFINSGPISAIKEITPSHVIHYPMTIEGKWDGDSIGSIFPELFKIINREPKRRRDRVKDFNPNRNFSKNSIRFLHDLIYLTAPVYFVELSRIIKIIFGECKDGNLKKQLSLLAAFDHITKTKNGHFVSLNDSTYFEYDDLKLGDALAAFKVMYLRYDPERIIC